MICINIGTQKLLIFCSKITRVIILIFEMNFFVTFMV